MGTRFKVRLGLKNLPLVLSQNEVHCRLRVDMFCRYDKQCQTCLLLCDGYGHKKEPETMTTNVYRPHTQPAVVNTKPLYFIAMLVYDFG